MKWVKQWAKRPYPPSLMAPVIEATVRNFRGLYPESAITRGASYWENALEEYIYPEEELSSTVGSLSKNALEKPETFYFFLENGLEKAGELREFSEKYAGREVSGVSSRELLGFLAEFWRKFIEMYSYATTQSIVGYKEDNPLYGKMNAILRQKTARAPEKFADYLVALTRPQKRLITIEQELAILKLAKKAKKTGLKTKEDFVAGMESELGALEKRFAWLSFDLCDSVTWDAGHYADAILQKLLTDIGKEIAFNEKYEENAGREFREACDALSLSPQERTVFELVRDLGYYKWAREHEFVQALYNLKAVQDELGRRCGLTTIEAKYLLHYEWKAALENPAVFKEIAQKRVQNSLLVIKANGETEFLAGDEAKARYAAMEFFEQSVDADARELKGMPARAGKARGTVKIINSVEDMEKMREGDVLVSAATSPQIVAAMKKASAIVTDEGGITCHAAIVSRELGIPCVVGTKIATKAFKDGDIVEVDAVTGFVKKVT